MPYLWFHAFGRSTAQETLEVLRQGPAFNPSPNCTTRLNEGILAIAPPHVYAYLGRTLDVFGNTAVTLPIDALAGSVSPFDTGGLVAHIVPLRDWPEDARRAYLARYSWPSNQLPILLNAYPTATPARRRAYLNCDRPTVAGPHDLWPTDDEHFVASIWAAPNEFRSWLWEGRSPNHLPINENLVGWSCPNTTYGEIRRQAEDAAAPADIAWFESLLLKYVDGGVSGLILSLRDAQEAA